MTTKKDKTEKQEAPHNLAIWDRLYETPPQHTKNFKKGGGFAGTSIAPTYIIRKLTEEFGPHGLGWGWEIVKEEYIEGAPVDFANYGPELKTIIHKILLKLYYIQEGNRYWVGPHFGQTTFVGLYKTGPFTDEEHAKKSITDAIGKCAVQLGLAGDVHMGLYDDNKYIKAMHEKYDGNGDEPEDPGTTTNSQGVEGKKVTAAQIGRLMSIKRDFEWSDIGAKALIKKYGYDSKSDIEHWEDYNAICKELQKGEDGKAEADANGYCTFVNGAAKVKE